MKVSSFFFFFLGGGCELGIGGEVGVLEGFCELSDGFGWLR